jgi:hypothetical protein
VKWSVNTSWPISAAQKKGVITTPLAAGSTALASSWNYKENADVASLFHVYLTFTTSCTRHTNGTLSSKTVMTSNNHVTRTQYGAPVSSGCSTMTWHKAGPSHPDYPSKIKYQINKCCFEGPLLCPKATPFAFGTAEDGRYCCASVPSKGGCLKGAKGCCLEDGTKKKCTDKKCDNVP